MDVEHLQRLVLERELDRCVVSIGISRGSEQLVATVPGKKADPTTRFYAASIVKQMVVVCLGLLERDGLLSLEDPIGTRVEGLRAWAEETTLLELVHHTAGLPNEVPDFKPKRQKSWTHEKTMKGMRLFAEPLAIRGTEFRYSGLGYVLLAEAIEKAADEPLGQFAARRLFAPLAMSSTELFSGPGRAPASSLPTSRRIAAPLSVGDGGLWSTAADLLTWGRAMNADTFGLAELTRRSPLLANGSATQYGGGVRQVMVGSHVGYSHGGSWPRATSKLVWVPETDVVVAILSTSDETAGINALADAALALADS